jgi:hypothetical protein
MLYIFLTIFDLFQLITYIKVLADFNETRYECQERTSRLVSIPYIPVLIKSMSTRRVFRFLSTLTEVFLCFFLSCKANAKVKPAKMGHGPHSS